MANSDKKKKLEQLFNDAQNIGNDDELNENLLATSDDLINTEDVIEHDYYQDLNEALTESNDVIDSMARLYLNDNENIVNHPYLKEKRKHDAINHADMTFLQKMAKKAIIKQLQQMDQGDLTPRHFETFYNGLKEIRENIKQATSTQATMENFYKTIREDLGITGNIGGNATNNDVNVENEEENTTLDLNSMNPQDLNEVLRKIKETQKDKKSNNKE